jgi:predicted CXXCH cytochrome family protein
MAEQSTPAAPSHNPLPRWLDQIGLVVQGLVAVAALAALVYLAVPQFRAAEEAPAEVLPPTMQAVDWRDPDSSKYCLACHQQVSLAGGGLAAKRGHAQNVPMNARQLAAVEEMGTVAGHDDRLICMSCHQLGDVDTPYMLAASLDDSGLCQRCHPGHYAQGTPHDLRQSAPGERNRLGQTVAEGGPCSACHLSHSFAREIKAGPLDPEGYCIGCHSTYGVAAAHARTTMEHPEARCRECHDPHDMTHGAFLNAPATETCVKCHEGYDQGRARGMHPVGHIETTVPKVLSPTELHGAEDPHELTCIVCHDTHEAAYTGQLRLRPDGNELCLRCHEDKLLEKTHDAILPRHGQQPILTAAQQEVVAHWGNPVGPNGELLCVSCHSVHGSVPQTQLLSFRPIYGETCIACHAEQRSVSGSTHDLRVKFPDLPNSAGLTPADAGECSPCHLAHEFPRERVVTAADPAGQCMTCHQEGDCGQSVAGVDHPETRCTDCHDPHLRTHGKFLIKAETALCTECHAGMDRLVGGPHDITTDPTAWPKEAAAKGGTCLPCHVAHGGQRSDLYRFNAPTAYGLHDGVCMSCHADAAWGADSSIAAIHPQQVAGDKAHVDLALVPTDKRGDKRMGCRTCHDPHAGAEPTHLARVKAGEPTEQLCLHCHVEKELIRLTGHAPERLAEKGYERDSCKPCHAMHATPAATHGKALSARFLLEHCDADKVGAGNCVPCMACHYDEGPGPIRRFYQHPEAQTHNILQPDEPGYLPLFAADGHVDAQGQVTCRTCHLSHGRVDILERLAADQELTAAERRSIRSQVRSFVSPNICTTCHGNAGRALYLFFHEPQRREHIKRHEVQPTDNTG